VYPSICPISRPLFDENEGRSVAHWPLELDLRLLVSVEVDHTKGSLSSKLAFRVSRSDRAIPGKAIRAASSPEHDEFGGKAGLGRSEPKDDSRQNCSGADHIHFP
jgi:hypothetical protein